MSPKENGPTVSASPLEFSSGSAVQSSKGPTLYASYPSSHPDESDEATEDTSVLREVVIHPLWCLHVSNILFTATLGVLVPVLPIYARGFGVDAVAGVSLALQGVGKVAAAFPNAAIAHTLGFRHAVVAACAFYAAVTLLSAAGASLAALLVASVGWGAATGLFFLARQTFCGHLVPKERRGRLLSLVGGTTRWGSVIGPAIGGALAEHFSVPVALAAQMPLGIVAATLFGSSKLVRKVERSVAPKSNSLGLGGKEGGSAGPAVVYDNAFMTRDHQHAESPTDESVDDEAELTHGAVETRKPPVNSSDLTFMDTMRCVRRHWRSILRTGGFTHSIFALRTARRFLLPLAALNQNLSGTWVGAVVAGSYLIDSCFFFISGLVMDTFGRKVAAIPASTLLGAAFLLLAWADTAASSTTSPTWTPVVNASHLNATAAHAIRAESMGSEDVSSHGTVLLAVAAVGFGIADSFGSGVLMTLQVDAVPPDGGPAFLTALNMIMDCGQVVGALVPSLVAQWWGLSTACVIMAVWGIGNGLASVVVLPGKLGVH